MRIAMLVARFFPEFGGVENQARLLSSALTERFGVDVTVLTRRTDSRSPKTERLGRLSVARSPLANAGRWAAPAAFAVSAGRRLLTARPRFDLVHCHQTYSPAMVGVIGSLLTKAPVVVKVTASDRYGEAAALRTLPFFRTRMRLLRRVDRFVAVSRRIREELEELGLASDKIVEIPNGVEIPATIEAKEPLRTRLNLPFDPLFVYSGRLSSEKRLETAIEAVDRLRARQPKVGLVLLGEGGSFRSSEASLRALVQERSLTARVVFTGRVDEPRPYLQAADAFILPSESEGQSNALLEALANGCPAVVTDIPANRDTVTDGLEGLKVPVGQVEPLVSALEEVCRSDNRNAEMREAARARAKERFAIEVVAQRYMDLYMELTDGRAARGPG